MKNLLQDLAAAGLKGTRRGIAINAGYRVEFRQLEHEEHDMMRPLVVT